MDSSLARQQPSQTARWAVIALLALSAVLFVARTLYLVLPSHAGLRDFVTLYAGGACLVDHCDPYKTADLTNALTQRGYHLLKDDWAWQLPIYPPPTLALMAPFAPFSFRVVGPVYYALLVMGCFVAMAVVFRSPLLASLSAVTRSLLVSVFLISPNVSEAISMGNPIILTTALLLICCFDTKPKRRGLRAVLFAIACVLKPPIALPFLFPLLLKSEDGWRMVRNALALLVAYAAAVLAWCSTHPWTASWMTGLRSNLALGASAGNTMNASDRKLVLYSLLNTQYLLGYWIRTPRVRDLLTDAVLLGLTAGFLFGLWRLRDRSSAAFPLLLAFAATAAFALLPIYHRFYDAILLVFVLPWAALAWQQPRWKTWSRASLFLFLVTYAGWAAHVSRLRRLNGWEQPASVMQFLIHRTGAVGVFCLTLILLAAMFRLGKGLTARETA